MTKKKFTPPQSNKGVKIKSPKDSGGLSQIEHPVFCFKYIEKNYCLTKCQKEEQAALIVQLHNLSQLSWSQIASSHRHGLGCEKIAQHSLKVPVPPNITKDVNFLAFRFDGKKPFVGYRDGFIFHILWIDRDFTLYEH